MEDVDNTKEEELSDFCRTRMQKISKRTLSLLLVKMRNQDKDSNGLLHFSYINSLILKSELLIAPCLLLLNEKFEDEENPGFTNYEYLVR